MTKVYICDRTIHTDILTVPEGQDVDALVNFVISKLDARLILDKRIIISDDDVSVNSINHYLLFNEKKNMGGYAGDFEEVNISERADQVHAQISAYNKKLRESEAKFDQQVKTGNLTEDELRGLGTTKEAMNEASEGQDNG